MIVQQQCSYTLFPDMIYCVLSGKEKQEKDKRKSKEETTLVTVLRSKSSVGMCSVSLPYAVPHMSQTSSFSTG